MYALGIDIGTESLRAGIADLRGNILATASSPYATDYPHPQWAEQDPEDWWRAAKIAVPECIRQAGVRPQDIAGIGLDAFASTMVAADKDGVVLRPAILWMDSRATEEAARIERTDDPALRYGGGQESVEWMLPRVLWLKVHEPEVYERADLIVEALDWLTHRLTGCWVLGLNPATDLWHYVPSLGGFPLSLLGRVGLLDAIAKFPREVLPLGERVGGLTPHAADCLGLRAGTPVACGGVDAHVGLLGLNALKPGQLGVILGSSTVHMALTDKPLFSAGLWGPFEDSILPGTWLLEGGQISTGSIIHWYKENMTPASVVEQAAAQGLSVYAHLDRLASQVPPGAGGLVALDYWQGNRTPLRDPLARGALLGLTLWHTPAHVFRALLEAAAYGTRHIVETYRQAGLDVNSIVMSGGGTNSELWVQIHADVCDVPITVTASPEACLLGSCIAGAVCGGAFGSLRDAAGAMVHPRACIRPDPQRHRAYDEYYACYRELYSEACRVMHRVACL